MFPPHSHVPCSRNSLGHFYETLNHISYFESITFCHISGLGGGLFMLTPDVEGDVMAVAGFEDFAVLASSEG